MSHLSILQLGPALSLVFSLNCLFPNLAEAFTTNQATTKQTRFVPGVVSIIQDHAYLRNHKAPTYWKISPFYMPQLTDASCSLAAATMVINAARIPQMLYANQQLATSDSVLNSIKNPAWANDVKQGGEGISLDKLASYLTDALQAYHVKPLKFEVVHATQDKAFAVKFHQALLETEKTGSTFVIVNFDQAYISGTVQVGHFAPVGAYDVQTKRVLLMDPDRELFEPYWVPEVRLVKSMQTSDSETHKARGFIILTLEPASS